MEDNFKVYMHVNKINKKKYIGVTKTSLNKRWDNGIGYKRQKKFYNSILKYGWDNFEHFVFEDNLSKEEAYEIEKLLIKKLKTQDRDFGYNVVEGGAGACGRVVSEEEKLLLSKINSGKRNPMYGKKHSEETRRKISDKVRAAIDSGKLQYKNRRKRIDCVDHLGNKFNTLKEMTDFYNINVNTFIDRIQIQGLSLEESLTRYVRKKSQRIEHTKDSRKNKSTKIIQYDINLNYLNTFESIRDASRKLNIPYSEISNVLWGRANQTHSWKFKFFEE